MQKKTINGIEGLYLVEGNANGDERGWFTELFSSKHFGSLELNTDWPQINMSHSKRGVFRGLHYQVDPYSQTKMLRVLRGSIIDVAVDLRPGPTHGKVGHAVLSQPGSAGWQAIYVPAGFAHGFVVLSAQADIMYHVSSIYEPKAEGGINWRSKGLGIEEIFAEYGIGRDQMIVNDRDNNWPMLNI